MLFLIFCNVLLSVDDHRTVVRNVLVQIGNIGIQHADTSGGNRETNALVLESVVIRIVQARMEGISGIRIEPHHRLAGIRVVIPALFPIGDVRHARRRRCGVLAGSANKGFDELNPFARFLINHNLDWIFKIIIIGIILFYFWKKRDIPASTLASWISLGVYTFMTIWWVIQIIVFIKYK